MVNGIWLIAMLLFEQTFETNERKGASSVLTDVFAGRIKKTTRTIYLDKGDCLIVEDELTTGEEQAMVTWIMVTPADAKIVGRNQVELK